MRFLGSSFLIAITALWCPLSMKATTIVDKPFNPSGGYGFTSHSGIQQIFEDFSIQSTASVNRITWYGLFSSGQVADNRTTGNFDVFLFHSDPLKTQYTSAHNILITGLPSAPAFYQASASQVPGTKTGVGDALQGGDIKQWVMDVPAFSLDPGKYWIVIRASSSEPLWFLWTHSYSAGDGFGVYGAVTAQNLPLVTVVENPPSRDTMAFSLQSVPEPTAFSLVSFSCLSLLFAKRRNNRVLGNI